MAARTKIGGNHLHLLTLWDVPQSRGPQPPGHRPGPIHPCYPYPTLILGGWA